MEVFAEQAEDLCLCPKRIVAYDDGCMSRFDIHLLLGNHFI